MSELPRGWVEARLGQVTTKIGSGATPTGGEQSYKASGIPLIRSLNVHFGGVRAEGLAFLDEMQAAKLKNVVVEADDVLLNITGASIGRVAIAPMEYEGARVNQHVAIIRLVQGVLSEYVCSFLASPAAQDVITRENYGATRQALTKSMIEDFAFPLPPLAEQKRVVAKLEALNAKSARARTELARVETLVSRYKQAVLSKAFSGELTEVFRHRNGLPAWYYETAANACLKVQSGGTPKGGFLKEGVPFLKVYNIVDQSVSFHYRPQYVHESVHNGELKKSMALPGDVLMNIVGPPLGKVAIVSAEFSQWNINQALTLFRPSSKVTNLWLYHFFCSGVSVGQIVDETKGSAGQINISLSQCRAFIIPIPSLEEQHEIVRRIESAFARIDRLAKEAKRALALVGRLDEAILAKAFRGELVPQDENDEPADRLLARLRAEREAAPKAGRGRGARS